MKNKKIYYLCYGAEDRKRSKFRFEPAAIPVVDYVSEKMRELGFQVEIVSGYISNKGVQGYENGESNGVQYTYFPSFHSKFRIINRIVMYVHHMELFFYLLFHVGKSDVLVIYHSLAFIRLMTILMRVKRIHTVLQIEEYFSYVNLIRKKSWKKRELNYFKLFDRYIFVNDVMADENEYERACVLYGPYRSKRKKLEKTDETIHIVYAGGITKGNAAIITAGAAEYLPQNYLITVIGYGTQDCIDNLKSVIAKQNKKNGAKVEYGGFVIGEKYEEIMLKQDIGVSLYQSPEGETEDATKYMFSSKILSYLSYSLKVVASSTESLQRSKLNDVVQQVMEMSSKEVAEAIMKVDILENCDMTSIMKQLDEEFGKNLNNVLEY